MAKTKKNKKGFSIYSLFGKIGDILFVPILAISLFSSISMLVQRNQNKPFSIANISLVNILSRSMTDAGFIKGDTVITLKVTPYDIELGDVIAFYRYADNLDKNTTKEKIVWYGYNNGDYLVNTNQENIYGDVENKNSLIANLEKKERKDEKTVSDAQKAKSPIYFHMVIGIYHDEFGNIFYRTKGTNNASYDSIGGQGYVRSDFVVGKYVNTPRFIRDTMSFCASTKGMIIMVCIPLSLLALLQGFSLIKQIEEMNLERQLIKGKRKYYDKEIKANLSGKDIETHNKAILYTMVSAEERDAVMEFMWGHVIDGLRASKREKIAYEIALKANQAYEKSGKAYWQIWLNETKGYTKRKLEKFYENNALSLIFANSNSSQEENKKALNLQETEVKNTDKETANKLTEQSIASVIEKVNQEQNLKKVSINKTSKINEARNLKIDKTKEIKQSNQNIAKDITAKKKPKK